MTNCLLQAPTAASAPNFPRSPRGSWRLIRQPRMANVFTDSWSLIRETVLEWSNDKVPQLGAALAFYTALSIAPLLVISLGIVGFLFGEEAARGEIQSQLQSL